MVSKKMVIAQKSIFKIAMSSALFFLLFKLSNKENLIATLNAVHLKILLYILILYLVGQIISVYKWSKILGSIGLNYSFKNLARAYFFGMFVNAAAFGTVGGDVARGIFLKPTNEQRIKVASSIIVDRVHGLLTLLLVAVIGFLISGDALLATAILACFGGCYSIWYLVPQKTRLLFQRYPIISKVTTALDAALPRDKKLLLEITLISASLHLIQILIYPIIFSEFGTSIPVAALLAFIPLINIASSLPLSIQGLGLREALLGYFFATKGLSIEGAISSGLIWFGVVTTLSLLSGLWILTSESLRHKEVS